MHSAIIYLRVAMLTDLQYAWTWYCNLAMMCVDSGGDIDKAHEQARQFLINLCDIDVAIHCKDFWEIQQNDKHRDLHSSGRCETTVSEDLRDEH